MARLNIVTLLFTVLCSQAALVPPLSSRATAFQGFVDTCSQWVVSYDGGQANLTATCTAVDGSSKNSTLDLNTCITNSFGSLQCMPNGNFYASCTPTNTPASPNHNLTALCGDNVNVNAIPASLDLSTCIGNSDGILSC